jgi:hypothetical protein
MPKKDEDDPMMVITPEQAVKLGAYLDPRWQQTFECPHCAKPVTVALMYLKDSGNVPS